MDENENKPSREPLLEPPCGYILFGGIAGVMILATAVSPLSKNAKIAVIVAILVGLTALGMWLLPGDDDDED